MRVRVALLALILGIPPAASAARPSSFQAPAVVESVDSAREEFDAGRSWHAAQILSALYDAGELGPEDVLLLARARAGYRDWRGTAAVLDGQDWLDTVDGGAGWLVLGRAQEGLGVAGSAADAYGRLLALTTENSSEAPAIRARLARMQWEEGDTAAALETLGGLVGQSTLRSWTASGMIEAVVEAGRPARVDALLEHVMDPEVGSRVVDARLRALLVVGDTAGAAVGYASLLTGEGVSSAVAVRGHRVMGDAARRAGDTDRALAAYLEAVQRASLGSAEGSLAASRLLPSMPRSSPETALKMARLMDRSGDGGGALRAYDRYVEWAEEPDPAVRVERARLLATVPSRVGEAIREWRALSTHEDPEVGVRALTLWSAVRRRQGRTGDYRTLRGWLVERYPSSAEAAGVVFFRADAAHDRRDWNAALQGYDQVATMAPAVDYAGLARMRAGQIHLHRGDPVAAASVFEAYLADFPEGRRWEEAAYWAARSHRDAGTPEAGRLHLDRLRAEAPFSYYAVLTADLLGEPYAVDLPAGPSPAPPPWLVERLDVLDALSAAGLDEGVAAEVAALRRRAEREGGEALLSLAEALNARDRTLTGINVGWAARRAGEPWSDRMVRIVYPFPYQELVLREAEEVGVDPLLLAALIRQESAFVPDIVSSAGAIGLMQVMPATGRDLARSVGVPNFTAETLESPEINLHLGARFLVDQLDRYGPELPLVLSAYNAGPARANRWRTFPEASDLLRLTERIPFAETRGYVKNVTRNRRLYEALYGDVLTTTGR
ncbi:MAG: transglycosylase SLT domain-containing protein [Gemmatimonadetes bacterium]|nr:transglycosylase SLT domain-containing protein [Gemmatimonadota bacterium]